MDFYTTVQDFTGVYCEQPFMNALRGTAEKSAGILWMDCTQISGTDCYCDDEAKGQLLKMIKQAEESFGKGEKKLPGIHFFDNGNYHYNSKLWTDQIREHFDLVIFDHHPDMQPPRFQGILSCGGWVKEVLDTNPFARNVLLIGVADHLIEEIRGDISAEFEKYADRVKFIKESQLRNDSMRYVLREAFEGFLSRSPVYISIDKDVLCAKDAVTNWDQGSMTLAQLEEILRNLFCGHKVLGVDICGERAKNQTYTEGLDERAADTINNTTNINLYKILQSLF
ncbi:MAG: arginase family protein [Fibrobacter sp.]|nr:arginase family protein [Fibrobacter sp.]